MNPSTAFGRVVRSLRRSPGFVAIATISMGVALGIATSVFAVMDAMTHPTPPFRDVEQLYRVEFGVQLASPPPRDSIIAGVARLEGVARVCHSGAVRNERRAFTPCLGAALTNTRLVGSSRAVP